MFTEFGTKFEYFLIEFVHAIDKSPYEFYLFLGLLRILRNKKNRAKMNYTQILVLQNLAPNLNMFLIDFFHAIDKSLYEFNLFLVLLRIFRNKDFRAK